MARVEVADSDVTAHLSPLDEVLALHGSLRIPYTHIRSVSAEPVPFAWYRGFKIGTDVPGVKVAGTFITDEGSIFECVTHGLPPSLAAGTRRQPLPDPRAQSRALPARGGGGRPRAGPRDPGIGHPGAHRGEAELMATRIRIFSDWV